MNRPYLRDLQADAEALLKAHGSWVVAGVKGDFAWPRVAQVLPFEGKDFILRPAAEGVMATIALNARAYGLDTIQAQAAIHRFTSALSWKSGMSLEATSWVSGAYAYGLGDRTGRAVTDFVDDAFLPTTDDPKAWIALALFREGLAASNVFYRFLSFFKVIASIHDGKARAEWMKKALERLDDDDANKRLNVLRETESDVGAYLFSSGRNAIAHAEKGIFVNPDEPLDYERIVRDTDIVKNLAEIAIEESYGLPRKRTRYEIMGQDLQGLRRIVGDDVWRMILDGNPGADGAEISIGRSVVVARRGAEMYFFDSLAFSNVGFVTPEILELVFTGESERIQFVFHVDLKREVMSIVIEDALLYGDMNSIEGVEEIIRFEKFRRCVLCNGRVEVWDDDSGNLVARTEPYVPLNVMVNFEWFESRLAALEKRKNELGNVPLEDGRAAT